VAATDLRPAAVRERVETTCDKVDCVLPAVLLPVELATAAPWVAWAVGLAIWGAGVTGVALVAVAD
jgi:hypothetical protein